MEGGYKLALQTGCPHMKYKGLSSIPVHAGLATAVDTRHCFHSVVNLTNVCSTQVLGEDYSYS